MTRQLMRAGVDLVKAYEGLGDGDPSTVHLDPYLDPVGIWSVGYGHAIRWNGRFLRGHDDRAKALALYPGGITREQADVLLQADLLDTCRDVSALLQVLVTDVQFAALVSFAYNCGAGALRRSTLLRKLHASDWIGAADEFLKWNRGGGTVLAGLTRRRQAERDLFLSPPQVVRVDAANAVA